MYYCSLMLACLTLSASGRDIIFPPVAAIDRHYDHGDSLQWPFIPTSDEDISLDTDAMTGLTSFAHLPHVPCFAGLANEEMEKFDIAILGAPFDTGTSYRPGARFGPHGIRDGSRRIRGPHSWNLYTGSNPFEQGAKIVDCGDAPLTFLDNTLAMKQLGKAHKVTIFPFPCLKIHSLYIFFLPFRRGPWYETILLNLLIR
jgi:agmatinase